MDPENVGKETIIRVTDWLRGIWEMKRKSGPVQQWVNSIPSPVDKTPIDNQIKPNESSLSSSSNNTEKIPTNKAPTMTLYTPRSMPGSPAITMSSVSNSMGQNRLARDPSFQSDSSHCSSVESLLELRKPDPEAILLDLGFGGCSGSSQANGPLSRIPKRFLQPSRLRGITIEEFVKQQQATNESMDSTFLGYRGLTGSPYIAPSEIVQKIMQRLREHESHELETYAPNNPESCSFPPVSEGRFSVLSPDNRQYLDGQRSRSPDFRKKRIIIGQKSFAFDEDGDLIEINSEDRKNSMLNDNVDNFQNDSVILSSTRDSKDLNKEKHHAMSQDLSEEESEEKGPSILIEDGSKELDLLNSNSETELNLNEYQSIRHCLEEHDQTDFPISDNSFIRFDKIMDKNTNKNKKHEYSSKLLSNVRRTSDSQTDYPIFNDDNARRFSDGGVQIDCDRILRKRRSLHRQARIDDTVSSSPEESPNYSTSMINNMNTFENKLKSVDINHQTHIESNNPINENMVCNPEKCDVEKCKSHDLDKKACKHDTDFQDCCHHKSSPSCWKKMRKIIKKNEKLENMVEKNRQEMAQIRDMLSTVLSVKMEPGF